MKSKLLFVSLLVVTATVFSGCQKVSSLLDIKVNTTFKAPMNMTATATPAISNTASYTYSGTYTVVPKDNAEVEKYANKIKDATITSITATFTNVSTPVTVSQYSIHIKDLTNNVTATYLSNGFNITEGGSYTFDFTGQNAPFLTYLESSMSDADQIQITATAVGDANATFTMTLNIGTTFTVNPL
ncbi:MAG: hypothetical protein JXR71_08675 [Bacteroidales bacterium]|nr:hypothetical protein [Bacteroidales bacterium]